MTEEKNIVLPMTLTRANALEIVSGKKKYEYRAFTKHWAQRLCNCENVDGHLEAVSIKHFDLIHFYTMNKKAPWHLDVALGTYGLFTVSEELRQQHPDLADLQDGTDVFIFELKEIIDTDLSA